MKISMRNIYIAVVAVFLVLGSTCCKMTGPVDVGPSANAISEKNKHYVIACNIYNGNFKIIKPFAGNLCVFLNDGSFISADPAKMSVSRYSANGEVLWKKNVFAHHSMVLSNDKKRLLFLSSEVRKESVCLARDDVFVILDVSTGKTLIRKSMRDFHKQMFDLNEIPYPHNYFGIYLAKISPNWKNTNCEATHFNAFYEIPENKLAAFLPVFSEGNFIASTAHTPYFFIFDKKLENLIFYRSPVAKPWVQFHDAQVLSDGTILYYLNEYRAENGNRFSAILKFSVPKMKNEMVFPDNPGARRSEDAIGYSIWAGSVQAVDEGYLIGHSDFEKGGMIIFADKSGRILKKYANPDWDSKTGKPFDIQSVKLFDLHDFLRNNKM